MWPIHWLWWNRSFPPSTLAVLRGLSRFIFFRLGRSVCHIVHGARRLPALSRFSTEWGPNFCSLFSGSSAVCSICE